MRPHAVGDGNNAPLSGTDTRWSMWQSQLDGREKNQY